MPAGRLLFTRRCTGCGRGLTRRECVRADDPQAPFGPETVCPDCGSLGTLRAGPLLVAAALLAAAAFVAFAVRLRG